MEIQEEENELKNTLSFQTGYFLEDLFDTPHARAFFDI